MWQCGSNGLRGGGRDCRDHKAGLDGLSTSSKLYWRDFANKQVTVNFDSCAAH